MEAALRTKLLADSTVASLVKGQVYPQLAPTTASLPYLVYSVPSSDRLYAMGGSTGLVTARCQVDCYATSYAVAKALATAVRSAINDQTDTTWGSVNIQACELANEIQMPVELLDGTKRAYGVTQDYTIVYVE